MKLNHFLSRSHPRFEAIVVVSVINIIGLSFRCVIVLMETSPRSTAWRHIPHNVTLTVVICWKLINYNPINFNPLFAL